MSTLTGLTGSVAVPDRETGARAAVAREYLAITTEAGYSRLIDRLIVRVTGDDRVTFLHGMCTADIKGMRPGHAAPALFVTERAHLIRDFFVYVLPDALLLEVDRGTWPEVRAYLERFLVADDVEIEELTELAVISCEGPACATAAAAAGYAGVPREPWRFAPPRLVVNLPRLGGPAITWMVDQAEAADLANRLTAAGLTAAGVEAREIVRVEHGLVRIGLDTTDKTLALEAGCEGAIAPNKGCYVGQETIERATARGGIKRRLCGLRINGGPPGGDGRTEAGAPQSLNCASLILAGKPVGVLTSVVESPTHGTIGLAILHHSAWTAGTVLTVNSLDAAPSASPVTACVTPLPFTTSPV